jgi:8-oxo-dGTP diphosphatase
MNGFIICIIFVSIIHVKFFMKKFYKTYPKYYVAVDCIIFGFDQGDLKLLVVNRNFEPHKGHWSLMGGFVEPSETLDESAKRVLLQLTGLSNIYMEQLRVFSAVDREPNERVLSVAYYALIRGSDYNKIKNRPYSAQWFSIADLPNLIFDHNQMVQEALEKLKRKTRNQPIGFELLPHKFTLPQLQQLYEAIFQKVIDKRNFRKKLLATGLINRDMHASVSVGRKGTHVYSFDKNKYLELAAKGFVFDI